MGDTYASPAEAAADRAQQQRMLAALNAWQRALLRDECGAWTISGKHGSIHTWGDQKTWVLHVCCQSVRHWTATKARLGFCRVTGDGDDEGCLRLHDLRSSEQAVIIRDVLGIRKRAELGPDEPERRRSLGKWLAQLKKPAPDQPGVGR
jgi:hypothetical protein